MHLLALFSLTPKNKLDHVNTISFRRILKNVLWILNIRHINLTVRGEIKHARTHALHVPTLYHRSEHLNNTLALIHNIIITKNRRNPILQTRITITLNRDNTKMSSSLLTRQNNILRNNLP